MYLFRKFAEINRRQSDVCKEAVSSVLDDVLKGKTCTIFNYGHWPVCGTDGVRLADTDMMDRILNDLFSHVYSLEVTMEINISITHMELHVIQNQLVNQSDDCDRLKREVREHFVASTRDVYMYMEKVIGKLVQSDRKMITNDDYPYALFTICVRQTNLDQSMNLQGNLQLVQLLNVVEQPEILKVSTPMASLLKIIGALASNPKTHLRYYNIRLTRILKDLLGGEGTTVIFNYTIEPGVQHDTVTMNCAKIWKALYLRERNKCDSLNKKIFSLEFGSDSGSKFQMDELLQLLKTNSNNSAQQRQLCAELKQIKADAEDSFKEMLEIQHMVEEVVLNFEQNTQQLEEKNKMLARLQLLLANANSKVRNQRVTFQRKLDAYSEMIRKLWDEQRTALQMHEQERKAQLSNLFDSIYTEARSTHPTQQLENVAKSGGQSWHSWANIFDPTLACSIERKAMYVNENDKQTILSEYPIHSKGQRSG